MPNIEIHGFGYQTITYGTHLKDFATAELRGKIFTLFKDKPYYLDMVVTITADETVDEQRKSQPFLRVVSTPIPQIGEIIELLKALDMDIEVQELTAFIPRKK